MVEGVGEVWSGGLGEVENRVFAVEMSDRISSLHDRVMRVVSKSLRRNVKCEKRGGRSGATYDRQPQIRRKSGGTRHGTISWWRWFV